MGNLAAIDWAKLARRQRGHRQSLPFQHHELDIEARSAFVDQHHGADVADLQADVRRTMASCPEPSRRNSR